MARVLGPPRVGYLPPSFKSWSRKKRTAFFKPNYDAGDELVRVGREQIRDKIAEGRQNVFALAIPLMEISEKMLDANTLR